MGQFRCSVTSLGATVNFISQRDLIDYFAPDGYGRFVPEMVVGPYREDVEYFLRYEESDCEVYTQYHDTGVCIRMPWNLTRNGETLLYAAYPFIELQHNLKKALTCHAACVYIDGFGGVMLIGKEGAGKTCLSLDLSRRHGARLIANDLLVIQRSGSGSVLALGGTKFFFLRYESILRNLPDLTRLFPEPKKDSWTNKCIVPASELGIGTLNIPSPIKKVFLVHIDETQENPFAGAPDALVTRLFLSENFSRYIRSTCTTILGGDDLQYLGYVPSLDNLDFYQNRVSIIQTLFNDLKMEYVSGKLSDVTSHVISKCR